MTIRRIDQRTIFLGGANDRPIPLARCDSRRGKMQCVQSRRSRADHRLTRAFERQHQAEMSRGGIGYALGKQNRIGAGDSFAHDLAVVRLAEIGRPMRAAEQRRAGGGERWNIRDPRVAAGEHGGGERQLHVIAHPSNAAGIEQIRKVTFRNRPGIGDDPRNIGRIHRGGECVVANHAG